MKKENELSQQEKQLAVQELKQEAGIENKKQNPYSKLYYETKHLPHYSTFDKMFELHGRQYICLKKARYYQLLGGILQKKIILGRTKTDTRVQVLYPLPTEAGKNSFIYSIKNLIKIGIKKDDNNFFTMSEPISFSPESLVGKFIEIRERKLNPETNKYKTFIEKKENRGHLDNDFIDLDECTNLIMSKDIGIIQAREYFSKSENVIGSNEVVKRLVDDLPSEKVAYFPKNTDSFYFQPAEKIPENIMTQGFMRRKIIPIGTVDKFLNEQSEELLNYKLESEEISFDSLTKEMISFLEALRFKINPMNHPTEFTFTEEAKRLIKEYSMIISYQGKIHSEKISNFSKVNKHTTTDYLIKMSCILASSYGQMVVDERFVSLAFMDLVEFMQNTFDFVFHNVKGTFDYGTTWKGARYYDMQCLKYLHDKGCHSFETSSVSIQEFLDKIAEVYPNQIKETQTRYHKRRMEQEGWVESRQEGQHGSRIWLKFNPKIHNELNEDVEGVKGYNTYNMVFGGLNHILSGLTPLTPSQP